MNAAENRTTERCCGHRAADHAKFNAGRAGESAGGACTIPGCLCKGWIPNPARRAQGLKSHVTRRKAGK